MEWMCVNRIELELISDNSIYFSLSLSYSFIHSSREQNQISMEKMKENSFL